MYILVNETIPYLEWLTAPALDELFLGTGKFEQEKHMLIIGLCIKPVVLTECLLVQYIRDQQRIWPQERSKYLGIYMMEVHLQHGLLHTLIPPSFFQKHPPFAQKRKLPKTHPLIKKEEILTASHS